MRCQAIRDAWIIKQITLTVAHQAVPWRNETKSYRSGTNPCCMNDAVADPEMGTKLGVQVSGYFLQRMKTKWGGCNHRAGHIRLNTELVKKPKDLLEYVVVHEMVHLIEPTHSDRFIAILTEHYPTGAKPARSSTNCPWLRRNGGNSMNVQEAVIQVLKAAGKPLHTREIAKRIIESGHWQTAGKTPDNTVSAQLYSNIKKNGEKSPFVKIGPLTFSLRDFTEASQDHKRITPGSIEKIKLRML